MKYTDCVFESQLAFGQTETVGSHDDDVLFCGVLRELLEDCWELTIDAKLSNTMSCNILFVYIYIFLGD